MDHLIFPSAILKQHLVALGKTGAGKSSALRYLVEWLLQQNKRVCIIDPKGDWSGLRISADGKRAGFPVVLFGDFKDNVKGDVPLIPRKQLDRDDEFDVAPAAKHVAELIASGNRPCVIGMRGWTQGHMIKFWIEFASTLFNRTSGELYLVIDEVHNFAPKGKLLSVDSGRCLHWTNRLMNEGRGIGMVNLIASQRPQKVHNDTLTACETLVAMRVVHAADRGAVNDWIKGCGDETLGSTVLKGLAGLKRGEAYVWSPEVGFGPEQITFPLFKTFDSFAPMQLQKKITQRSWEGIDLAEVREKLARVIEQAKQDDPDELHKIIGDDKVRIALLTKQLAQRQVEHVPTLDDKQIEKVVEMCRITNELFIGACQTISDRIESALRRPLESLQKAEAQIVELRSLISSANIERLRRAPSSPIVSQFQRDYDQAREAGGGIIKVPQKTTSSDDGLENTQQAILDTIRLLDRRGIAANRESVARWMGKHPNGGRYGTDLARLRADGYLDGFVLTDKGLAQAREKPTGLTSARAALKTATQQRILDVLAETAGVTHTRDSLAQQLGIHPNGGRYGTDLAWLRTMGLIPERGSIALTAGARR